MNNLRTKLLRLFVPVFVGIVMVALAVVGCASAIHRSGVARMYDDPAQLPVNDVGLVLGTYMRAALQACGVPAEAITLDDAGFRTLDSVARAKEVFGQSRLTIITDRFHAYRALFLARHYGIDAVAYPSAEVEMRSSMKARIRKWFADTKACLDLYVLHTQPRFLGPPIPVKVATR